MIYAVKTDNDVAEKAFEKGYGIKMKGVDTNECTTINFLAFNYDGAGSAIVEEVYYKKGSGLFSSSEVKRTTRIISASEVRAIVEGSEYSVWSSEEE